MVWTIKEDTVGVLIEIPVGNDALQRWVMKSSEKMKKEWCQFFQKNAKLHFRNKAELKIKGMLP